jgi:hypothetical protein
VAVPAAVVFILTAHTFLATITDELTEHEHYFMVLVAVDYLLVLEALFGILRDTRRVY